MVPETRWRLRRAWGMCERHAWGAVAVEASYRHGYMHGPALLYQDIMERAVPAFRVAGPLRARRLARNLRPTGPCMMCEMGLGPSSTAKCDKDTIERGRDLGYLRGFAEGTREHWWRTVCGRCLGGGTKARCRSHLRSEAAHGQREGFADQRAFAEDVSRRLTVYARSFVWGYRHLETAEGRAALISAIGWCSGWRPLLASLA